MHQVATVRNYFREYYISQFFEYLL